MLTKGKRAAAILEARKKLGLPVSTSLRDIKQAYRDLARESHPDLSSSALRQQSEDRLRELNLAYEILIDYCERYTFSFMPEAVDRQCRKQDPLDYWQQQFVE